MILFDTETTGLPGAIALPIAKQPYIIELCAVRLNDKTLKEEAVFDELINTPGRPPLEAKITQITGITEVMLKGKLPFIAHLPKIVELFLGERYSVAHNHDFDANLLEFELRRLGREFRFPWAPERICTVEKTVHLKGHRLRLGDVYELVTGRKIAGAHRAINDVRAVAEIVRWLRKKGKL